MLEGLFFDALTATVIVADSTVPIPVPVFALLSLLCPPVYFNETTI